MENALTDKDEFTHCQKRREKNLFILTFFIIQASERNGFLWDTSRKIKLMDNGLLERKDKTKQRKKDFVRRPFIGYFKVRVFDFWKKT